MSNCLIFALSQLRRHGGYLIIRKSRYGWWPHFMWVKDLKDLEVTQYVPPKELWIAKALKIPPIIFKGSVKVGKD